MKRPVSPTMLFVLAVAVQALVLAGMAADQLRVVRKGTAVRVPVVPVDPMSLFSGEYARLGYEFSSLDQDDLAKMETPDLTGLAKGDGLWVVLSPGQDGLWHPKALRRSRPADPGTVAVRGEVRYFSSWAAPDYDPEKGVTSGPPVRHISLTLHLGLESFYVPEGTAAALEKEVRAGEATAELAVLPSGRAAVRSLIVKGVRLKY